VPSSARSIHVVLLIMRLERLGLRTVSAFPEIQAIDLLLFGLDLLEIVSSFSGIAILSRVTNSVHLKRTVISSKTMFISAPAHQGPVAYPSANVTPL